MDYIIFFAISINHNPQSTYIVYSQLQLTIGIFIITEYWIFFFFRGPASTIIGYYFISLQTNKYELDIIILPISFNNIARNIMKI